MLPLLPGAQHETFLCFSWDDSICIHILGFLHSSHSGSAPCCSPGRTTGLITKQYPRLKEFYTFRLLLCCVLLWFEFYVQFTRGRMERSKMYRWTHLSVLAIKNILQSSPLFAVPCQLPHIFLTGPWIAVHQSITSPYLGQRTTWSLMNLQ